MEITKSKVNVKRFSRSKVDSEPIEEPVVENKTRGRKKKVVIEEPVIEEPIIDEPVIEEPQEIEEEDIIPESFDDNFLSELNATNYQKEQEEEENREAN